MTRMFPEPLVLAAWMEPLVREHYPQMIEDGDVTFIAWEPDPKPDQWRPRRPMPDVAKIEAECGRLTGAPPA